MTNQKGLRQFNNLTKSVWSREGIGLEAPEIRHRHDAKLGSMILREACIDLFQRTSIRNNIPMDDAMACHLGFHSRIVIPGKERVRKTAEMERWAA